MPATLSRWPWPRCPSVWKVSSTKSIRSGGNSSEMTDGSARYMPAGVRLVEASILRHFPAEDVVCCYPEDLSKFIGPRTRAIGVSTHNPLGVTFAAGVYASIFGSSKEPINSHYATGIFSYPQRQRVPLEFQGDCGWFGRLADLPDRRFEELSVDCVVEGRSESDQTLELFQKAIRGEPLPRFVQVTHPTGSRRTADAAQANHFRRSGDDHRLRTALPILSAGSESADRLPQGKDHGGRTRQCARRQ